MAHACPSRNVSDPIQSVFRLRGRPQGGPLLSLLTFAEAMWKGKAVIGGNTGGIRLQVVNHHTGFLVNTPEGASLRIRHLLQRPEKAQEMGLKAREFVRENFLITRHLKEYLSLMVALLHGDEDRIRLEMNSA